MQYCDQCFLVMKRRPASGICPPAIRLINTLHGCKLDVTTLFSRESEGTLMAFCPSEMKKLSITKSCNFPEGFQHWINIFSQVAISVLYTHSASLLFWEQVQFQSHFTFSEFLFSPNGNFEKSLSFKLHILTAAHLQKYGLILGFK